MDRKEFFSTLKKKLYMQVSKKEIASIIDNYNKYFDESENEEEAIKELGDISLIAEEIIHPNPFVENKKFKVRLVLSIFSLFGLFFYLSAWFFMPISKGFVVVLWIAFMVSTIFISKDEIFEIKINSNHQKKMSVYLSIGFFIFIVVSLSVVLISSNAFLNNFLSVGREDAWSYSYSYFAVFTDISNLGSILADTQVIVFIFIGVFSVFTLKIGKNALILGFFNIVYLYALSLIYELIYSVDLIPESSQSIVYQQLNYIYQMFIQSFLFNIICFTVITMVLFISIKYYRSKKYDYSA